MCACVYVCTYMCVHTEPFLVAFSKKGNGYSEPSFPAKQSAHSIAERAASGTLGEGGGLVHGALGS